MSYYAGSGIRVTVSVRDIDGDLATPDTIVMTHENAAGTRTVVDLTNDALGVYYGDYTFLAADADTSGTGALNEFEVVTTNPPTASKIQVRVKAL